MQQISKAIVDGSLKSIVDKIDGKKLETVAEDARNYERERYTDGPVNRHERRAMKAAERKLFKARP